MGGAPDSSKPSLVIKTTIKGKSVFAKRSFKKGEYIIDFRGKHYTKAEYMKRLNPKNNHFLQVGSNVFLGPTRTPDNYINHSCNPNSGIRIEDGRVMLFSIRPIGRGEEVTFDYSTTMAEDYWEMDCACGHRSCRKRVRDFRHLPETVKKKYMRMGIVPDFITRPRSR
jgi:SET domain-containing protein